MADKGALLDLKWWLDAYEFSSRFTTGGLTMGVDPQPKTTFADTTRLGQPGLRTVQAEFGGLQGFGSGEPDDVLRGKFRVKDVPFSVSPITGAEGDLAYGFRAMLAEYRHVLDHGRAYEFQGSAQATDAPLVAGTILHVGSESGSGTSTALQVGSVSATQKLYAWMHALSATGSLDVTVESDDASGMASPTTRATFTQATAIGSEWLTAVDGPITDDWWRANFTIVTGPFDFVVIIGIQ